MLGKRCKRRLKNNNFSCAQSFMTVQRQAQKANTPETLREDVTDSKMFLLLSFLIVFETIEKFYTILYLFNFISAITLFSLRFYFMITMIFYDTNHIPFWISTLFVNIVPGIDFVIKKFVSDILSIWHLCITISVIIHGASVSYNNCHGYLGRFFRIKIVILIEFMVGKFPNGSIM